MTRVLLLTTGGTIASRRGDQGLEPQISARGLLEYMSDLRAHYHIDALILDMMRLGEHGEGLSHAGGVPEEHLEPAAPLEALRLTRFLFLPDSLQDGIGVAAAAADLPSLSNFRHVTCPFASSRQRPCILARPIPQPHLIRYPFPSGFLQARQAPLTPARRRA